MDVRAIAEGVATLTVEDVCGKTATATVEVRPVASVSLAVHLGGLPGSFAMPAETTAPGIVVLPEARAYVAATPRDALGRRIYDAGLTWSSTAPSTLLDYGEYDEETGIYTAAVQPDEGVAGAVVSSSAGGELNVAFPPEAEVADALLLDWHGNGPLTNVEVPAGASFAIEFFPLDGLARPIFGAPSEEPGMTVDDDRVATGSCCGVWDATAIPQFRIQGLVQGETGVTLTAFGQTRTLDVRVSAP